MNRFVFAIHRGGSSVLGGIAKNCALGSGATPVMLGAGPNAFKETGADGAAARRRGTRAKAGGAEEDVDAAEYVPQLDNWRRHSGVFAPIRRADFFPVEFFAAGDRAVLNIRDPRDCMVSGYYGFLRLHGDGLRDPARREKWDRGIDAYVLDTMLERYVAAVRQYVALTRAIPDIVVLKYEDMVTDFDTWFARFYDVLGFDRSRFDQLRVRQAQKFSPPEHEDIDAHKRQMLPGDHLRKLKPETIETVNARLAPELAAFGYA